MLSNSRVKAFQKKHLTRAEFSAAEKAAEEREEAEFEARQKAHAARIASLRAKCSRLRETIAARDKRLGVTDWLLYLPGEAGGPEFTQRACTYLEQMRTRVEAEEGRKLWLCKDHDFVSVVFVISEFRGIGGCVFCTGEWTDLNYRERFKGVSLDHAAFAGDIALLEEISAARPPGGCLPSDLPLRTQIAADGPQVSGLCGAVCIDIEPAQGRSPIFRLTRDKASPRTPTERKKQ